MTHSSHNQTQPAELPYTPVWAAWRLWRFARLKFNWRHSDGRRARWIESPTRWVHVVGPIYYLRRQA